jgi:predicted peroxiredoxin
MEKTHPEKRFTSNAQIELYAVSDKDYENKVKKLKKEAQKLGIELWVDEPVID